MRIAPLTQQDVMDWADLLAICFDRQSSDLVHLIGWLHRIGQMIAWGAWEDDQLVAQYSCLLRSIECCGERVYAGMSINMAVHPDYRGQGLVKQLAEPVYQMVRDCGGVIGLGFSNAQGVQVDRHSKSYGYRVIGQMEPLLGLLSSPKQSTMQLTYSFPDLSRFSLSNTVKSDGISFSKTPLELYHRYETHPFRRYQYGVWRNGDAVRGIVIYREIRVAGVPGVALLDTWGEDQHELLRRWGSTIRKESNAVFVQVLVTPNSLIKNALTAIMPLIRQPYSRNPYFCTVKPLLDEHPQSLFEFNRWQFTGGDIL